MKKHSLYMVRGLSLLIAAACASTQAPSTEHQIVLLHVSDLHSQLLPGADGLGGYSKLMAFVETERQKAGPKTDVVLSLGGDLFGKGSLPCRKTQEKGCASLVGMLKPDVVAFGNNELKIGHDALQNLASKVGGAWVGTNVEPLKNSKTKFWRPSYVYQGVKSGIKLQFIAMSAFPGPGESVAGGAAEFRELSAQDFINIYQKIATPQNGAPVLLVHDDKQRLQELSTALCSGTQKPLLALKAHEHNVDEGKVGCLPYVEAGSFAQQVARIVVRAGAGSPSVGSVNMVSLDGETPAHAEMEKQISALYKVSGQGANRSVLNTTQEWSKAKVGKFLALAYQKTSKADVAIVNSGAIKMGFAKGSVDWETVLSAVPYNNELVGLDWSAAELEKSLCQAAQRPRDRYLDQGADLIFEGAELLDAGTSHCRLVVKSGKKKPKIVIDSYLQVRSARWLGRELKSKTFFYGLDTERALELGIEKYGKTQF